MNGAGGYGAPFKNHPVKSVYGTFRRLASRPRCRPRSRSPVPRLVSRATTPVLRPAPDGVLIQSYPHFTPGYFHFVKSAAHVGAR